MPSADGFMQGKAAHEHVESGNGAAGGCDRAAGLVAGDAARRDPGGGSRLWWLVILLLLRLIERPLFGLHRPWTPWIVQAVCRAAFRILGMAHRVEGERMRERGGNGV